MCTAGRNGVRDGAMRNRLLAEPFIRALVPVGTEHGGDLELDQLLQAASGQLGDQFTGAAAIQ